LKAFEAQVSFEAYSGDTREDLKQKIDLEALKNEVLQLVQHGSEEVQKKVD